MNIKKPVVKIIQIGTLFVFTSLSFLWMISFSQPEISSFWTVSTIHFNISSTTYADDDEEDEDEDEEDEDEEDDDDNNRTVTPPVTTPVVDTPTTSSGTTSWTTCQTVTETVYDTVTSASGTKTKVPRTVTKKVCTDGTTSSSSSKSSSSSSNNSASVNSCNWRLYCADTTPATTTPIIKPEIKLVSSELVDGTYTWIWKYSYAWGSVDYWVELVISSGKITSARFISFMASGNGLYTRIQADSELSKLVSTQNSNINVVTGASGTSKAIQDAIDNALTKAKNTKIETQTGTAIEEKNQLPVTQTPVVQKPLIKKEVLEQKVEKVFAKLSVEQKVKKLTSIQTVVANLIDSLSLKILTSTDEVKIAQYEEKLSVYLVVEEVINSQLAKYQPTQTKVETKTYSFKALNGKTYTIIDDGKVVSIKKADGSFAKQTFKTYAEAVAYLNINAVNQPKVQVAKKVTVKKTVVTTPAKTQTTVAKTTPTTTKTTTPVVTKPVVTTPKVDTTTKAS